MCASSDSNWNFSPCDRTAYPACCSRSPVTSGLWAGLCTKNNFYSDFSRRFCFYSIIRAKPGCPCSGVGFFVVKPLSQIQRSTLRLLEGCPKVLPRWIRAYAGLRPVWNFLPCDGGLARLRVVGSLFAGDRPCMRKCLSADEELLVYPLHQIERSLDG